MITSTTSQQSKATTQTAHSKIPSIIAAVICLIFALWSTLWFWSAVLTVRPETVITQWEEKQEEIKPELAQKMIARLKQSIAINPIDANSHLLMAKYYQWLANNSSSAKTNNINISKNQYTALAEQAFKNAIKHQPSGYYAWAKLAQFYSNQQPLNQAKLKPALSNAMLLGPFEQRSRLILIPLLFKHWSLIANNTEDMAQATKIIKLALKTSNSLLTLNSAKTYQKLAEITPLLTKQWHKNFAKKHIKETANDQ
ncbi:hypothetical protein L3081_21395 [Colwellia sp. MSW7]|uniref:Tetratricopeptide repeat protein n=1 Tax=Colwellia maritima TaxID=2912588 RepID=A0ABS9X5H0_9GAMM|nr:hypothetical protein [Colwellia maritima]MCI2285483.1 hypothetical protein [Colwellia maritima]